MKRVYILALVLLAGCTVENDVQQAETSAAIPSDYEGKVDQWSVVKDRVHCCEYVVINSSIFVWRGTNLIAYTGPKQ